MGKLFPLLGIMVIIGGFWFLADSQGSFEEKFQDDFTEAKRLVNEFGNSGEKIVFYIDPQAPIAEYTYVETEVETEVFNYDTGEIETVTTTEVEKVKTSEISVNSYDRQTANTKVCKRGNQCDITGEITLIDPTTGLEIQPPYGLLMQIVCETSHDPILQCSNFSARSQNILTFGDKSFLYTFTTNSNDPLGTYSALVSITSKFTITDPETGNERPVTRDGVLKLEIVE